MTAQGWTRTSNINGLLRGTYDVINFWRRGPDVENMSDIPVYTSPASNQIIIGWAKESNYKRYIEGHDDVIACWPTKPSESSITLYIDENFKGKE